MRFVVSIALQRGLAPESSTPCGDLWRRGRDTRYKHWIEVVLSYLSCE